MKQIESPNENLIFIDDENYKVNQLDVTYIINRNDTCLAALKMYLDVITENSVVYKNKKKLLEKLNSFYGAKLTYSIKKADTDYVVNFKITTVLNKFVKGFRNIQLEAIRFIDTLIREGWGNNRAVFTSALEKNITETQRLEQNEEFSLIHAVHNNFIPNLSYGIYPYGTVEEFKSLKDVDLSVARNALLKAQVLVTYIGDCNANALSLVNRVYKPSPFIAPLRSGDFHFSDEVKLVADSTFDDTHIALVYITEQIETLKVKLIEKIIVKLIANEIKKVNKIDYRVDANPKIDLLYKGNIIVVRLNSDVNTAYEKIIQTVTEVINSISLSVREETFNHIVKSILFELEDVKTNPVKYSNFIIENKLCGLEYDLETQKNTLSSITLDDVKKKLNKLNYFGSLVLKGKKGE